MMTNHDTRSNHDQEKRNFFKNSTVARDADKCKKKNVEELRYQNINYVLCQTSNQSILQFLD